MSWESEYKRKVIHPNQWKEKTSLFRENGYSIATLNGSFDLLHAGHLKIIYEASQQADILIVGLNSDTSIKQYKSLKRPIITLEYRLQIMAALEFVDYVTWFEETNPIRFLEEIRPNIHVNGQEYGENCIESETVKRYGGTIHIVDLKEGLSTSDIILKINNL